MGILLFTSILSRHGSLEQNHVIPSLCSQSKVTYHLGNEIVNSVTLTIPSFSTRVKVNENLRSPNKINKRSLRRRRKRKGKARKLKRKR